MKMYVIICLVSLASGCAAFNAYSEWHAEFSQNTKNKLENASQERERNFYKPFIEEHEKHRSHPKTECRYPYECTIAPHKLHTPDDCDYFGKILRGENVSGKTLFGTPITSTRTSVNSIRQHTNVHTCAKHWNTSEKISDTPQVPPVPRPQ